MATKKKRAKKTPRRRRISLAAGARRVLAAVKDARKSVKDRIAAAADLPLYDDEAAIESMLEVLRSRDEPVELRLAVLQALQAASFSSAALVSMRADYMSALREAAQDPDLEMRQRALGMLAREHDGFAQKKLIEGLKDPAKALLPPEKALQLLSYDVHSGAYQAAREIVEKPPNPEAKREALRLLAADAASAPLLERILRDKDERADIRQVCAAALHAVNPQQLQSCARDLVMDETEYPEIQTTSLTAMTQFGREADVSERLLARVRRLREEKAGEIRQRAEQFLGKYLK